MANLLILNNKIVSNDQWADGFHASMTSTYTMQIILDTFVFVLASDLVKIASAIHLESEVRLLILFHTVVMQSKLDNSQAASAPTVIKKIVQWEI